MVKETKILNVLDAINELAFIKMGNDKAKDSGTTNDKLKKFKDKYSRVNASVNDIAEAVVYMTQQYANLQEQLNSKNAARYDVIVRALENNRVLSKKDLASVKKQLKTINEEGLN